MYIRSQLTRRVVHIHGINIFVQNVSYVSVPLFLVIHYLLVVLHSCNNNDSAASLLSRATCHVSLAAIEHDYD